MEYSAEHIRVFELDEIVRRHPGMYFRVGAGDPRLPTEILLAAVSHIYHPPPRLGPPHLGRIEVVVLDNLVFSVTDDVANEPGKPGYGDTLIPGWRLYPAAAAAASTRSVIETWRGGHGLRQELAGVKPVSDPVEFEAPEGTGTHMLFELDAEFVGAGSAITHELDALDLHGPDCYPTPGSVPITFTDRRLLD